MIGPALAVVLAGQTGLVLPGVVDLPVLEGAAPAPDCLGYRDRLSEGGEVFECLGAPLGRINDLTHAYIAAASARGWTAADGAANAMWMSRTLPDGTCQRLTVAAMWDFARTSDPRPSDPGLVVISFDADAACPVQAAPQ